MFEIKNYIIIYHKKTYYIYLGPVVNRFPRYQDHLIAGGDFAKKGHFY